MIVLVATVLNSRLFFAHWSKPHREPNKQENLFQLREKYYPGGIGFDPLNLTPSNPEAFAKLASKELSNGRLAMLAIAGFCAQELATGLPIFH
jgi:hypothetical protein